MEEVWKIVDVCDNYAVSNLGRVKRIARGNRTSPGSIVSPVEVTKGRKYLRVCLYKDGVGRLLLVHRLVALAFLGEPPIGYEVGHIDGDPSNNTLPNLKWCTKKENAADREMHGTHPRGEASRLAKLTETDVLSIRQSRENDTALSRHYKVSRPTIRRVRDRLTWVHI